MTKSIYKTQLVLKLCQIHIKMTSTPTETNNASTEPPPAKKQKPLEIGFKGIVENVQRILECLVCFNIPENTGQVQFCSNGHLLCDSCYQKILGKKCPTCESERWNGHHSLKPLMDQILSFLPKPCPFSECETQFENKDREEHLKNCQHRMVDCVDCTLKLPFNTFLKHMKEVDKAYIRQNTDGCFNKNLLVKENIFSEKKEKSWISTMTEFDEQTFIIMCGRKQEYIYFQMFLHGNETLAENYLWRIKVINRDDPRHNTSFTGEVISVDVPIANQERQNHSGTFCFAKTMVRKLICKGKDGQILSLDLAIIKKE